MKTTLVLLLLISLAFFSLLFIGCASTAPTSIPQTSAPTVDVGAVQTQAAIAIFATQTASVPTVTPTPPASSTPIPTNTPTDTPLPSNTPTPLPTDTPTITPTPTATIDVAADKKTFASIDVRELKKNPDKYRDQKIVLRGEVFTIQEGADGTGMQIWVNYPGGSDLDREAVVVQYPGSLPNLFEKDTVVVYGLGAGQFTGTNSLGGQITQPLIAAQYVDYGASLPTPVRVPTKPPAPTLPPVGKNAPTKLGDKWGITYVGEFRDKIVFFYDTGKTAFGTWATIEFRVQNSQSGTDNVGSSYSFVAIDQDGKSYPDDIEATGNARWEYCGCSTLYDNIDPGAENVIVITFDVPETTTTLTIVPTDGAFSDKLLAAPRFVISNFDQVAAFKHK